MSEVISKEFEGKAFLFREDGWFNMTWAAKAFGKQVHEYLRLASTDEYTDALVNAGISRIYDSSPGRYGGTWGHPKLAVHFARWLDVKFAVFCDMVIDDILSKKAELTITKPQESASMALPQSYLESLQELVKAVEERERLAEHQNIPVTVADRRL